MFRDEVQCWKGKDPGTPGRQRSCAVLLGGTLETSCQSQPWVSLNSGAHTSIHALAFLRLELQGTEQSPLLVAQNPSLISAPEKNLTGPVPPWRTCSIYPRPQNPAKLGNSQRHRGKGRGGMRAGDGWWAGMVCVCQSALHVCMAAVTCFHPTSVN